MTTMRDDIKTILRKHPGIRKRQIAGYLHVWLADDAFLITMREMERAGEIRYESFSDPANMEFYDKWYIQEEN